MVYTKNFLNSKGKRLPYNIKRKLGTIKRIDKVFPKIGLKNCVSQHPVRVRVGKNQYANWNIGFTSDGIEGLWNLATMSMRGVLSCMHWESYHSTQLVGSISDPCTGMVYLTDGTPTQYGVKFKRRSLVRYALDKQGKPFITIDKVYADTGNTDPLNYYTNFDEYDHDTRMVFETFLRSKLKRSIGIMMPGIHSSSTIGDGHIPAAPLIRKLDRSSKNDWVSCLDHNIDYAVSADGYKHLKKLGIPITKKTIDKAPNRPEQIGY